MKNTKIKTALMITLVILILALLIGGIVALTRSSDGQATTLYVKRDGKRIKTGSETEIEIGKTVRFDVGYDLSFISGQSGYHVKITPRITEETDFTYTVDGKEKKFSEIPALSNAFNVVAEDGFFTLKASGDLPAIIAGLYSSIYTVEGVPYATDVDIAYFTLTVLSADQTESVEIYLKLTGDATVTEITVSPGEIVF